MLLGGCMLVSAILFPAMLRLPAWVEAEVVVAAWWVTWSIALAVMLHSGRRVADDHAHAAPTRSFGGMVSLGDAVDVEAVAGERRCGCRRAQGNEHSRCAHS